MQKSFWRGVYRRDCANGRPATLQYALPLTRLLASACARGIVGVIALELLYHEVQQSDCCASCRTPGWCRTPESFLVSSRNERGRESPSSATFQTNRLVDTQAESPGDEYPIMKIYVSNLPAGTSGAGLADIFEPFGIVTSAHVMTSCGPGHSRGFGFVERQEADDLVLRMNEARAGL